MVRTYDTSVRFDISTLRFVAYVCFDSSRHAASKWNQCVLSNTMRSPCNSTKGARGKNLPNVYRRTLTYSTRKRSIARVSPQLKRLGSAAKGAWNRNTTEHDTHTHTPGGQVELHLPRGFRAPRPPPLRHPRWVIPAWGGAPQRRTDDDPLLCARKDARVRLRWRLFVCMVLYCCPRD